MAGTSAGWYGSGPDLGRRLAIVLYGLAAVAWAAWQWRGKGPVSEFLNSWMPNLGTDFLIIAVTLTVFDRIQKHQKNRRARLQVDWIWQQIGAALRDLAVAAECDYTETHVRTYKPPPSGTSKSGLAVAPGTVELLKIWRDGFDTEDNARADVTYLIEVARTL